MITENTCLPRTSKSKVKGFSLGFNALDAEMSQMVPHYSFMSQTIKSLVAIFYLFTSIPTNVHLLVDSHANFFAIVSKLGVTHTSTFSPDNDYSMTIQ
jgi:hypothetical protein